MFADTDLRQVAQLSQVGDYPAGLGDAIGGPQSGSWMYTGALENHPELIDRWQQTRPLLGNSAEVVRRIRNPELLRAALRNVGLAAPAVRFDCTDLPRDGTWLAKPRRSAGGTRLSQINEQWCDTSTTPDEFYFQQRISGTPVAAVYLATTDEVILLGITEQLCGAAWGGDSIYRYCGSIGPLNLAPHVTHRFQRVGEALQQSFALVGLFGVDAILQDDIVWPVEVNPRYTASVEVIERATTFPAVAAHVVACQDHALPARAINSFRPAGKLIVWANSKCVFPAAGGLPAGLHNSLAMPTLADIPAAGSVIEAGWPIATVLTDGADLDSVRASLQQRAAVLRACCFSD